MSIDPLGTGFLLSVGFFVFLGGIILIAVGLIGFMIYAIVRNVSKMSKAGHNPLTMQSDLAVKMLDSDLLAPKKSTEERLAETDDLLERKVISAAEHAAARAAILAGA